MISLASSHPMSFLISVLPVFSLPHAAEEVCEWLGRSLVVSRGYTTRYGYHPGISLRNSKNIFL